MYTITETKTVPSYETIMYRVKIAVDTAEDIPDPLDEWAVGSEMEVYENGGSRYKLGTDREWYPVNFKKGSGGGDNSEVADQVNQNTSSISLLTGRVSRIETNIGGHTVKSDVPENAVFTDTVYDDSEAKEDIEQNKTDILSVRGDIDELEGKIFNTDNLLLNAEIVPNKYYVSGVETDSPTYTYAIIPMVSGKTYVISKARFIADKTSLIADSIPNGYEFTPTTDGDIYITFYKDTETNGEWAVYEKGKDSEKIGTYQNPAFSQIVFNQIAASPVDIKRISGIKIKDGTDLSPLIVEEGDYGYMAQTVGGVIQPITYEGYKYFKLPINGANRYYLDDNWRWWFATNADGAVVDSSGNGSNLTDLTVTSADAELLWVTYKAVEPNLTTRKIAVGSIPTDTVYLFPDNVETNINPEVEKNSNTISRLHNSANLFNEAEFVPNKYYYNNTWYETEMYAVYSVFVINVEAGKTYQFGCNVRALSNNEGNIKEKVKAYDTYAPTSDETLYCSVRNEFSDNWKMVELPNDIDIVNEYGVFSFNSNVLMQGTGTSKTKLMSQDAITKAINEATSGNVGNKIYGKGFAQVSGNLNDGDSLTVPKTNLKKNNIYSFMANITTMGTILIGHGKNTYSGSWIEINDTNVINHAYSTTDSTKTYPHGLTISGYIYVQVIVKIGKADINIYSNGQVYTITDAGWNGDGNGDTFVESVGSILTECIFTWSSEDFRKSIWMFGDSYFSMTSSSRWVKYLVDAGYADNVLLNAYPGESTTQATPSLNNMIEYYGTPNFIVWCLGMNDGSDADESTPTTTWSDGINYVLNICNEHGITPVFATIPTVPNINHEGKNNFIRNSGYRYIDFAKAVNAQPDGTWISGMLSSDNVHPSETGARALYFRAIADCPEITFSNP